ncbi:MAG: ABC transporter substrate-binding protein [Chloroflexi bacterium]|nr:ABC transporter substrate-binding protein [Chloroflexota bacterium]
MRSRSFLAVLLFVVAACSGGGPTATPLATAGPTATPGPATATPPAFPVTITDDEGTDVTIKAEPHKIVSLTPATTEILFAIGAGGRVVGKVEDVANFPKEAASIPIVATFSKVDVEKIVALGPDLVVSGGKGLTQGVAVEQLRKAGIPVLVSYPTTLDGALQGMRDIGQAVGLADAASTLSDSISSDLYDLSTLAGSVDEEPRVFYEIDVTGGIYTPPADSIYGEMFDLANASLISGDANYSISLEKLVAADPEVILLGDGAYGVTAAQVKARAGWGGMTAVKDGRIVVVDDIVITRPGPRLVEGLKALIKAIHPDLAIP